MSKQFIDLHPAVGRANKWGDHLRTTCTLPARVCCPEESKRAIPMVWEQVPDELGTRPMTREPLLRYAGVEVWSSRPTHCQSRMGTAAFWTLDQPWPTLDAKATSVVTTTSGPQWFDGSPQEGKMVFLVTMLGFLGFIGGVGLFVLGSSQGSDTPPDPRRDRGGTGYGPAGVWGLLKSKPGH